MMKFWSSHNNSNIDIHLSNTISKKLRLEHSL